MLRVGGRRECHLGWGFRRDQIFDGYRYEGMVYLELTGKTVFLPNCTCEAVDLIYLCFPNIPLGSTISREMLKRWAEYAREQGAHSL